MFTENELRTIWSALMLASDQARKDNAEKNQKELWEIEEYFRQLRKKIDNAQTSETWSVNTAEKLF